MLFDWLKFIGGIAGAIYLFRYWVLKSPLLDFLKGDLSAWILKYANANEGLFVCFVAGIVITAIVHSSSLVMWTLAPLVATSIVPVNVAIAMILGANIGTCIDGFMAAGAFISKDVLKVATAHLAFNTIGNLILFPVFLYARHWLK